MGLANLPFLLKTGVDISKIRVFATSGSISFPPMHLLAYGCMLGGRSSGVGTYYMPAGSNIGTLVSHSKGTGSGGYTINEYYRYVATPEQEEQLISSLSYSKSGNQGTFDAQGSSWVVGYVD